MRAASFVAGYYRDPDEMRARDPDRFRSKLDQGRAACERYEATGEVETTPTAALKGDAATQRADMVDYFTRRAAVPNYRNAFAVTSREHFLPFDVQAVAPCLAVPVLLVHSERALSPAWAHRFFDALPGERELVWLPSSGQTAFYDDPTVVTAAADQVTRWLLRYPR